MRMYICDYCKKEINSVTDLVTINATVPGEIRRTFFAHNYDLHCDCFKQIFGDEKEKAK